MKTVLVGNRLLIAVAAWLLAGQAGATSVNSLAPRDLARQAELVFVGEVTRIDYQMSASGPGLMALPHTLVSYQIDRVLKGEAESGSQITLRFQGGPVPGTPRAMVVEGTPTFDVGDRDVLFVRGNGSAANPVVGWWQGRLRLIKGEAYSEAGNELWLGSDGSWVFGPAQPLPEVLTWHLGHDLMTREMVGEEAPAFTPPAGARRAGADELTRALEHLIAASHRASELAALRPEPSVDSAERIEVRVPDAATPPQVPNVPVRLQGERDPAEESLLGSEAEQGQ
jgi:hypothetical protein